MKSLRLPILLCLLCPALTARAGRDTIAIDTVQLLKHRAGTSAARRFSVSRTIEADAQVLGQLPSASLGDYLVQQTPVYVRQSGAGQSASVSTRGTAATHTTLQWNGLPVGSLTMGQADLSRLPLFFFDNVSVQLGGESSLYGSGSIGGNIALSSKVEERPGLSCLVQQSAASYANHTGGVKIGYANARLAGKTALLYASANNNFEFENTAKYGSPREVQRNAGYRSAGLMQRLRYRLSDAHSLELSAWYMGSQQQIQPTMPGNLNPALYDSIEGRSLRTALSYNGSFGRTQTLATLGYCYDRQDFRSDLIATHHLLGVVEAERPLGQMLRLKLGLTPQRIAPLGNSYAGGLVEWRTDLYAMGILNPTPWLQLNASARQSLITGLNPPVTYAAGVALAPVQGSRGQLQLTGSLSTTYRAPSLNERYWGHSINSYLQPEEGRNLEVGARYRLTHPRGELLVAAGTYRNVVSNWIRWMPYGSIWKPVNLLRVRTGGLDATANGSLRLHDFSLRLNLSYAYSLVNVLDGGASYAPLNGYQMAYSPKYRGSGTLGAAYRGTDLFVNLAYVGLTHSSDIFDIIPAYTLVRVGASQTLTRGRHGLELLACANNLLNKAYQSIQYFAMPGRSYELTLKYYFQTN